MKVGQALVAIGGRASRLREAGIDVAVSKSFIRARDKPLLYWCLNSLYLAGVRRVVLAADRELQLVEAESVLQQLPFRFDEIKFFRDKGLGVHGLPYYADSLLEGTFIFECGHSVSPPEHYHRLDTAKTPQDFVFSAYTPHSTNLRYPVQLIDGRVTHRGHTESSLFALAHPFMLDKHYSHLLPQYDFDIRKIIDHCISQKILKYVLSTTPPEFDTAEEMQILLSYYHQHLPPPHLKKPTLPT